MKLYKRDYLTTLPSGAKETFVDGLYALQDGTIYAKDLKGYYKINPYLNTNGGSAVWKSGYYKFHFDGKTYNVHTIIARTFCSGYKPGLVVDHINNNSLDNNASNLQFITRSENSCKFWASLNEEDLKRYKESYINGIKRAHAGGAYKNHLAKLHKTTK